MNLQAATAIAAAIGAVGVTLNAVELRRRSPEFDAFFDWRIVRTAHWLVVRSRRGRWLLDTLGDNHVLRLVVAAQVLAAWTCVAAATAGAASVQGPAAVVVVLGQCAQHVRLSVGLDGSDQMQTILWTVVALLALHGVASVVTTLALAFLVAQLVLSYVVAGVAKAVSPIWLRGQAVAAIVGTREYGTSWARALLRWRAGSFVAGWAVIVFEVTSPALLLAGGLGLAIFLVAGVAFHLAAWAVMGLRSFVFAFGATYPLVTHAVAAWR